MIRTNFEEVLEGIMSFWIYIHIEQCLEGRKMLIINSSNNRGQTLLITANDWMDEDKTICCALAEGHKDACYLLKYVCLQPMSRILF